MDERHLEAAVALARRGGPLIIATSAPDGTPHVATAAHLARAEAGRLEVTAWFCAATVDNLAANARLALVVWRPGETGGYQIVGTVESVAEDAMLDGWVPDAPPAERAGVAGPGPVGAPRESARTGTGAVPQVRRVLRLRPQRVLGFADAPHADEPLEG